MSILGSVTDMDETQKVSETEYQPVDGEPGTCPDCGEFIQFDGGDWMHESGQVCSAQV